jgi:Putative Flp pilus-assembly TadE/G-like
MTPNRPHERGQMLALFAICLVAIIAVTGLVIDGGLTMVQRRDEQNVADAAAMAGAYSYANTKSTVSATGQAQANAAANGYVNGTDNVVVTANVTNSGGLATVVVTVTKPHRNFFSGVVGFGSWDVSATATAVSGLPNSVIGAMPLLFNKKAFPSGQGPANEVSFNEPGSGTQDVPQDASTFNWTVYCTANGTGNGSTGTGNGGCNGDSNTVNDLINNKASRDKDVNLTDQIGPLNAGSHTTLFSSLASMVGESFPVAVVADNGGLVGWAMFHLTGSVGGSTKQIRGYFVAPVNYSGMRIVKGAGNGGEYGDTVVQLTN